MTKIGNFEEYEDVAKRIKEAVKEVDQIRRGDKPKRNWREMMARVRKEIRREANE